MMWSVMVMAVAVQEAPPQSPINSIQLCRKIASDADRVACYDRAADALSEAQRRKDIVVMDRTQVQKAKRSLFGFSLPSIRLFDDNDGGGKGGDGALRQVTGTVQSATSLSGGLLRFTLDDDGVWESTEQATVPPRRGDVVTIKGGSLGSYIATAPGRRSVRVRRVR